MSFIRDGPRKTDSSEETFPVSDGNIRISDAFCLNNYFHSDFIVKNNSPLARHQGCATCHALGRRRSAAGAFLCRPAAERHGGLPQSVNGGTPPAPSSIGQRRSATAPSSAGQRLRSVHVYRNRRRRAGVSSTRRDGAGEGGRRRDEERGGWGDMSNTQND